MSAAEMLYELTKFFFSDILHYAGLILLILVLRGVVANSLKRVKTFFSDVKVNLKKNNNGKPPIPADVEKILKEK